MNKKLKTLLIIFFIAFLLIFIITVLFYFYLYFAHFNILNSREENVEYYSSYSIQKNDYTLKTKVDESDELIGISFVVEKNGEVVYDSKKEEYSWRALDFKKIEFDEDSLDIIVESSDTGNYRFQFDENYWYPTQVDG